MPKETIHDAAGVYDVQVGWSHGQHVQVGVGTADHQPLIERLLGLAPDSRDEAAHADMVRAAGEIRRQLEGLIGEGPLADFTGLWATLDREGCNRLIRTVRQARDKAYGRDE